MVNKVSGVHYETSAIPYLILLALVLFLIFIFVWMNRKD